MKVGDLIIEYTEGGDIEDLIVIVDFDNSKSTEHIEMWETFNIMKNRIGWWNGRDILPFYINDWLVFELIEV